MPSFFPDTITIGGVNTARVTRRELAELMVRDCMAARSLPDAIPKLVFSLNGQGLSLIRSDHGFAQVMRRADLIHADGMPVVAFSRLQKKGLPERVATTDFFHDAAAAAIDTGLRFFMLGASDEQNARAVAAIRERYPALNIVGRHHGYFGDAEEPALIQMIREARPDVLWVALGKPKQEFWSDRIRSQIPGVGWIKTCGGLYAFLTSDAPRAPRWMQISSLEWLHRAAREPLRLGPRYAATNLAALAQMVRPR